MDSKGLFQIIKSRRSIFPNVYIDKKIPDDVMGEILEAANWAPNNKCTEPWRFKVMTEGALVRLSDYMSSFYKEKTPKELFSEKKYNKIKSKALQSAAVIAIVMQRDPKERVIEVEEIEATAMAVQNMWLMAHAHGIGSYWGSPKMAYMGDEFLGLKEGERCLGFFFMGYHEMPQIEGVRGDWKDKVTFIKE